MGAAEIDLIERAMRRWIALVDARDVDGLRAFVDEFFEPDAWIDFGTRTPDALPGRGVEIILDWARDAFADPGRTAARWHYELRDVVETGYGIVATARSLGRIENFELETPFTYLFQVRDGKIVSMNLYATPEEAAAAAASRDETVTDPPAA